MTDLLTPIMSDDEYEEIVFRHMRRAGLLEVANRAMHAIEASAAVAKGEKVGVESREWFERHAKIMKRVHDRLVLEAK